MCCSFNLLISLGRNTTLTLQTHDNTFPSDPQLGHALSKYKVELPAPKLVPPKNPNHPDDEPIDEDGPRFIDDATVYRNITLTRFRKIANNDQQMHLFSSTATFTLLSPLPHTTIYITHINATALYNHTEIVGNITYDLPFAVPPGASTSPRLPVDWSLGSVGYDAVKQALGGTLKLDTRAVVGVKVGAWEEVVNFQGRGIGAHVQL